VVAIVEAPRQARRKPVAADPRQLTKGEAVVWVVRLMNDHGSLIAMDE
jgi:hypothetical protein